jgi:drug/metabolite transporter (DMT)-like permease
MLKLPKLIQLHIIILLWGFTPVLGKLISLPADELVIYRLLISGIGLWLFIRYKKITLQVNLREFAEMMLMGFIVGFHWYTFYQAIKVSNVSMAMAGFATITLFASIMQPLLLNKKFFAGDLIYGLFIVAGLYIILNFESVRYLGIVYGVLAAFSGAFFGVYNGKLITKHQASVITLIEFLGALVALSVFRFIENGSILISIPNLSDTIYLVVLSVFCTTLAFTWSISILKHFTPFTVIMTNNLEPVYGISFSILLFGTSEFMSWGFYVGAAIILFTVFTYPIVHRYFQSQS